MKRDFSSNSKQELLSLVDQVENEKWCDFTDWFGDRWYDFEAWIGKLDIKDYIDNVNEYHKKVIDKNNTTSDKIIQIFEDVNVVSSRYRGRLAALLSDLEGYIKVLDAFADVVDPSNGMFDPEYIGSGLKEAVNSYLTSSKMLQIMADEGLTQEDVEDMGEKELQNLLDMYASSIIDNIPGIDIGEELELPVGPGVTFYYKVSGGIEGTGDIEIQTVIEDQKLELKGFDYSGMAGGINIGAGIDADGKISVDSVAPSGNGVSLSSDGLTCSYESTVGINTYTYTYGMELTPPAFTVEESVKTELEGGSITSTIGLKYEDNTNKWKPMPAPVPVESPYTCQIPEFDVDWEIVGDIAIVAGVAIAAGALIIITNGAAAPVLLAV